MIKQQSPFRTDADDDRGQVGIGTLIVFIALVLVAAIAAGVLINTAGFLQSQAEATGQESTDQVSNAIQVVGATGEVTDVSGDALVTEPRVVLSLGPGSDAVDLSAATYQIIGNGADSIDSAGSLGTTGSETITLTGISGGSDTLLSDSSDRIEVAIDLDAASNNAPLGNTASNPSEVELTITTADGSQTTAILSVPDYIDSGTSVRL
jgi:flagellin FlaB